MNSNEVTVTAKSVINVPKVRKDITDNTGIKTLSLWVERYGICTTAFKKSRIYVVVVVSIYHDNHRESKNKLDRHLWENLS